MADPRGAARDIAALGAAHSDLFVPVRAGDLGALIGAALVAAVECAGIDVQAVTGATVRAVQATGAAIDTTAAIEQATSGD